MGEIVRSEPVVIGGITLLCVPSSASVWVFFDKLARDARLNADEHWHMLAHPAYRDQFRTHVASGVRLIDYRCVPTWLNKIDLRVYSLDPDRLRALQVIQRDCAAAIEKHFFGAPTASQVPADLASLRGDLVPLDVLENAVKHLRKQQAEIAAINGRISEVSNLAADALEVKVLGSRGQYFTVVACYKFWRLPAHRDAVNNAGREIVATSKREGWHHELEKIPDTGWGEVNSWPAARILRWFTDRHFPCPTKKYRDMLDQLEGLRDV